MKRVGVVLICVCLGFVRFIYSHPRCGLDNAGKQKLDYGITNIETFPWLGLLYYPVSANDDLVTSTVVLITPRMVLAAALDIDQYPKDDFRMLARVVLGQNCSGEYLSVRDYTYHPDFRTGSSYSTLAIVQLETLFVAQAIHPICPPSKLTIRDQVYALSLIQDCTSESVKIYKMVYVDPNECKEFYKRTDLDILSLWPTHVTCARATRGGHCVWRGGTVMAVRADGQWRLLGFGVNGPGCEAPARFLDYGMYHPWVKHSLSRIGNPAITRIDPGYLILRRTIDNIPRYGECDEDEKSVELFKDITVIKTPSDSVKTLHYNLPLLTNMDYKCVLLRVTGSNKDFSAPPTLRLRRTCASKSPTCWDYQNLQIDFLVEIKFYSETTYEFTSYGKEYSVIDVRRYTNYTNKLLYGAGLIIPPIEPYYKYAQNQFVTSKTIPDSVTYKQNPQNPDVQYIQKEEKGKNKDKEKDENKAAYKNEKKDEEKDEEEDEEEDEEKDEKKKRKRRKKNEERVKKKMTKKRLQTKK